VTAGGKTLNHAQIQFYKQQQLLRQQQQRLLRDHQLKVLQAQSASNQKVSVAVTAGTTMGIATVAGVTAVQVSQAQQQRAQVTTSELSHNRILHEVRMLYEPGYIIPYVGSLMISIFE
jgi:selenocysteine lyase/cysteine desulfurase